MRSTFSTISILVGFASASTDQSPSPIKGYEVQEPSWKVEVVPGQPPVVFNGSIQQVLDQLQKDYPEYALQALEMVDEFLDANDPATSPAVSENLSKRDSNICRNFPVADRRRIYEGISYLHGVKGTPSLKAGPRVCSRVSCSHDSGIWWCNDNTSPKSLGSFKDIANAATVIANDCAYFAHTSGWFTSGQRFHNDGINVIVRGDEENC